MHIFVDTNRLLDHLNILHKELYEIGSLNERLELCRQQWELIGNTDLHWIYKQQQIVRDQRDCIERRISLINSIIDRFNWVDREVSELLVDTESKLHSELR